METQHLHIGNMVCDRCVSTVRRMFREAGWRVDSVELGRLTGHPPPDFDLGAMGKRLADIGFELHDEQDGLMDRIKGIVIRYVYDDRAPADAKLSDLITASVHREYSHLSRTFSAATGRTIEAYHTDLRMERARNLLATTGLPIADIGSLLKYAAPSHFSAAFRRATGQTPSAYRKDNDYTATPLDKI